MNKSEFIDAVAEKAELTRAAAARVVDAIFDTAGGAISHAVHHAGSLSIPGFGKFTKRTRAARTGRNPRTGAEIKIPERTTIGFSAGRGLKEQRSTSRRKTPLTAEGGSRSSSRGSASSGSSRSTGSGTKSGGSSSRASSTGGAAKSRATGSTSRASSSRSGGSSDTGSSRAKSGGSSTSSRSSGSSSKSGGSASKGGSKSGGSASKSAGSSSRGKSKS